MSKRAGDFVTLRDVVDEVGRDPIRFMMIFRKNDAPLDFDFAQGHRAVEGQPGLLCAVRARPDGVDFPPGGGRNARNSTRTPNRSCRRALDRLTDAGEMALIRRLAEYPRVVESAAKHREPHRVAFYLHDLASEFHGHWNRGKELPQLRFIVSGDPDLTAARLALVHGVRLVLASGLAILGVSAPDEMR